MPVQVERPVPRPDLQSGRVEGVQEGRSFVGPFLGLRLAKAACTLLHYQQVREVRHHIVVEVVDHLVVDLRIAAVVHPGLRGKEVDLAEVPKKKIRQSLS